MFSTEERSQMKKLTYLCALGTLALFLGCNRDSENATGGASDTHGTTSGNGASADSSANTAADNTGKNIRDRSSNALTSGDQGENQADLEITRRVRRAVTANDQLSAEAKNIKIITLNGKVTLRGPVKSEEERKTIDALAQKAGGGPVDDQLEVTAGTQQ